MTKIYRNIKEIENDIQNDILKIKGDVRFECPLNLLSSIEVGGDVFAINDVTADRIICGNLHVNGDLDATSIQAYNITAKNISAGSIDAFNIIGGNSVKACKIYCNNIKALMLDVDNIIARKDISCDNIICGNIIAENIKAINIVYGGAICSAYTIECMKIKAIGEKYAEPICLNGKIKIVENAEEIDL